MAANKWLDQNRPVEQMTWAPGLPMLVENQLISDGGWIDRNGVTMLNLYIPPTIIRGDGTRAQKWRDHLKRIYPDDAEHMEKWFAHCVQRQRLPEVGDPPRQRAERSR
jgi:hypothetical protein